MADLIVRVIAEVDKVEKLTSKFKLLATGAKEADYAFRQGKISAEQLKTTLEGLRTKGETLNGTYKQMVDLNATLFQVQARADVGFKSLGKSLDDINNSVKRTNPAFMSFNQIVQDAPFGIRGVGNNIQFLTQQFTQLRSQGLSTKDILSGMMQNVLTPMGALMFAVSAGTSLLTVAMDALGSKTEKTAEKTKTMNQMLEEQSGLMYGLGEITRNQRISDLEDKIAEAQVALDKLSKSEIDFQATVLARTKDPNAVAVYRVIGTPAQFKEAQNNLRTAQTALRNFIDESKGYSPLRDVSTGMLDVGFSAGEMSTSADRAKQGKALFNLDQRREQLLEEGRKYQQQQAEELAQIREDAEKASLQKTEDNLRQAMNVYNSVFFDPLKASFNAIATGSGNMADAFIQSIKRMIAQLIEMSAYSWILSMLFPGAGTFGAIFGKVSGLAFSGTETRSQRSVGSMANSGSIGSRSLRVEVVGNLRNDHIAIASSRGGAMLNMANI